MMSKERLDPAYLRQQIVGVDSTFNTPFGERLMVYCDYTASGRCLRFVESYLQSLQRVYANTHTEDDITGRSMSQLLHEAEEAIKKHGSDALFVDVRDSGAIEQDADVVLDVHRRHRAGQRARFGAHVSWSHATVWGDCGSALR